jgi:copper transport protein
LNLKKYSSLLIVVLYLFVFLYPSFASAHAYIIKSSPSENETLKKAPQKVTIQFDETIQSNFNSIEVFDSNGKRVDRKNGHIDPNQPSIIECSLNKNLPNGTYRIQWRVVSSDGHPVQGVIPFSIGTKDKDRSNLKDGVKGYTPHLDLIIIRWLQYVSNACFVGILFFYLFVLKKELGQDLWVKNTFSKLLKFSFITLCLSIILNLPLQATIESGLSWSKVLNVRELKDMLANTNFGRTWIVQIDCLFILFITTYLLIRKRFKKPLLVWISFIIGIGLLLSKSFTGHAASSTNVFLSITIDFFHLLSASIWIGSLVALVALIPISRKIETKKLFFETVRRFSKWGIIFVIVLSLTGFLGSLSYIPNLRTLFSTGYGRVLSGKVILLVFMIVFAAVNFVKGKQGKEKGLRSTIWGELTIGMIVLVLSVLLTNLPTAMASPGPIKETNTVQQGNEITFEVTPNVIGLNTFQVSVKDRHGHPIKDIEQVTLTFTSSEMAMGDETKTLVRVKDGKYEAKGMNFNMAGLWNVHVHVLTKELESIDTNFKVIVGSQ